MSRLQEHVSFAKSEGLIDNQADILFASMKPVLLTRERIEAIGLDLVNLVDRYKIYIGPDVNSLNLACDGMELPASVLDDFEKFRMNVLSVIHSILEVSKKENVDTEE